jgi:AhpD family alkylhydroperoxidase
MTGNLLRSAFGKSLRQIQYVTPVQPRQADDLVGEVYAQVEREFGILAPPLALHSPAPRALAASWMMLRESLVVADQADRDTKEAIATAVSFSNTCPYCVDVHSMTLEALGRKLPDNPQADHRIREVADWARTAATKDGATRPPCSAALVPELIGVVVTFHYINRMVNVFLPDTPLPPNVPPGVRGRALRMAGRFLRPATKKPHRPGESLSLLRLAGLPPDLAWAGASPHVAGAFARAAAAIDEGAARSVPASVQDLVRQRLSDWTGSPPAVSRSWVDDDVACLPEADRPAGRLALLTALASFQLDDSIVEDFRQSNPDDSALVELTSWASMAAARMTGAWIPLSTVEQRDGCDVY